jgi:hypothetical protein
MISLRSLCAGRTEKEGDTNDREHAAEAAALGHRCSICEVTPRNVALQRWRRQQTDRPTMRVTPAALWWHTAVVYQIYPQSFQASDRDGIDGLRGIQRRLDHIVELVAKRSGRRRYSLVRWPISGMTFLITPRSTRYSHARPIRRAAHRASPGLRPQPHIEPAPWFEESRSSRDNRKRDWYIWRDPAPDGGIKREHGAAVRPMPWLSPQL